MGLSTAAADLPDLHIHLKALPHGPSRTNRLRPFNIFPRQLSGFLGGGGYRVDVLASPAGDL